MIKKLKPFTTLAIAALSLNSYAAIDMFLELDSIKGESQDKMYKENVDVLAWSWGLSQSGSFHEGGGSGAGKASFQNIAITKWVDSSSMLLYKHLASGDPIKQATLRVRKAGKEAFVNQQMTMYNVLVSSASVGGSGGEDRLTDNVTLNFESFCMGYTEQTPDGSAGGKYNLCWNIAEANPCSFAQIETLYKLPLVMSMPRHLLGELTPVCTSS